MINLAKTAFSNTMKALSPAASALGKLSPKNPSTEVAITQIAQAGKVSLDPVKKNLDQLLGKYKQAGADIKQILSGLSKDTKNSLNSQGELLKSAPKLVLFTAKCTTLPEDISGAQKAIKDLQKGVKTDLSVAGDKVSTALKKATVITSEDSISYANIIMGIALLSGLSYCLGGGITDMDGSSPEEVFPNFGWGEKIQSIDVSSRIFLKNIKN